MKSRYLIFLLLLIVNLGYASTTTKPFALSATITGGTTVCQNSTQPLVTFTGIDGIAPYTFVYQINGTNQPAITTIAGQAVTIQAPTGTAGSFIYTLVSVQDSSIPVTPIAISGSTTVVVNTPHTVDFTFTNDSTCSGTAMQFTPNVSGVGSATYSWDFGDGTPISTVSNPSHTFNSTLGCGIQNFNVNLTVTKNGCTIIKTHTITVKQKPNISFTDVLNPFNQFNNCNNAATNPVYTIKVGNTSQSSCISTFSVNWGDGIIEDNITFPKSHTYATTGVYSMVITALGANGCNNSKTYTVKNVSNPLGGLNSPGSTQNLCTPTANLQFSISSWGTNSLDTTYNIDYGDGSTLVLTQSQLNSSTYYNNANPGGSSNYPIPHIYTTSSCPLPSFELKLNITNACSTTPIVLGNISTLSRPIANFNIPNKACVATPVLFTNTTIPGYNLSCDQNSIYEWDFGDGSPIVTTGLGTNQNISHSYLLPGTYSAMLTVTGYCGPTSITKIICIEPAISASFNLNTTQGCAPLAITTTNTTVLNNQCSTPTYKWEVTHSSGFCSTTNPTFPIQTTANASYNFTETGTYTIKFTTTNSCGSTFTTKTVQVKKPPTASINAIATFCNSATITPTAVINSCAPASSTLTYAWSFPGGTPATASTVSPGSVSYAVPGNKTISLVVTNECGASATATQTFTVNPTPTITNTIITQTVCSGTSSLPVLINAEPSGATFSWTATATVGISGFIPSGITSTIPAQTLTTTSAISGTVTYVVKPKIGTCEGASFTYTITVIPAPKIITQPLVSSKVCLNGSTPPLTVSISPTAIVPTYQWYSSGTNTTTGGTLIDGANTATYSPLTNTVGTVYYYCVITLSSGGCPNLTSATGSVEVVALPLVTAQPIASQILCVGGTLATPLQVVYTSSTGVPTFQWYRNTVNSTTSGTAIPGATSATYTPPIFTVQGSYYYYLIMTFNGSGCGTVTSTAAEIIVTPDPSITSQPLVSQTLCSNATPTALFVAATGGNGSFIYQWFRNTSNNTTGGVLISGATSATYSPPTGIVGITFYYCVITQSSPGCSVTSETAQLIIKQSPTASILPISSISCVGGSPNILTVTITNGVGTPTYQWYSNIANNPTSGSAIIGQTSSTFTPPSDSAGTTFYYCLVTFDAITGSCSTVATNTSKVEIIPAAVVSILPIAPLNLCVGVTISSPLSVSYTGGTGNPTYKWFSNTTSSNTGGTLISGANTSNYTPPTFNTAGTFYFYAQVSLSGSGCGAVNSSVVEIIVSEDPTISSQPIAVQTLCSNATPTDLVVVAIGGNGSFNYQWYSNTTNSTSGGTLIPTATTSTYSPPTGTVGTTFYYCLITQSTLGCNVTSAISKVIINASPVASILPISSISCVGGSPNILTVTITNGVGTPTYQWYSNIANNPTSGSAIIGQTSSIFTPPSDTAGTTFYYCLVTFDAITGSCSTVATNTSKVEIIPAAVVSILPIAPLNLCVGVTISSPLSVSYTGGTGNPTYKWFSNTTNSNTGGVLIAGANSNTYTPPTFNTAGTFYFYAQVSLSGSGCGAVNSSVVEIIISEDPTISSQPIAVQTLCSNATPTDLVVIATGGNGTFSYQWYSNTLNSTTGGTLLTGATSASYTPPTGAVGTTFYYCLITQSTLGCNVTSAISKVIINASPIASILPISSISCVGGSPNILTVTITNGVGTPTYQWYSNIANNPTSGSAIAGQTSSTFTPPSDSAGTTFYYCLVTFDAITGSCSTVATNTSKVEIIPAAVVSILPIAPLNLCVGVTISSPLVVSYTGGTGNPTYKWFSNTTNSNTGGALISGATAANYTPPTFNTAGTFYFYAQVSLSGSGCGAVNSSVVAIIVSEDPTISSQPIAVQTLCSNAIPTDLVVAAIGGNGTFSYQWYSNTTNSTSGGTLIAGATSTTYTPITSFLGTVYYYCIITQSTLGCNATSNTATIIVNPSPSASITPTSAIACLGGTLPELSITTLNGAGAVTYQWYYNTINNTSTGTAIPFAINATFTPPSNVVGVLYYFCTVTFAGIEGSCATVQTNTTEITITPALSISQNPLVTQSLCVGVTIANELTVSFNGGTGIASYQWYSNNSNDTSTGTEIPGANEASYTPPVFNSAGTFYFYAKISLSGIGCGAIYSNTAKIIVVIDPIITLQPVVIQTLCQNATPTTLSVIPSGGIGTLYNYQWYSSTTNSNNGGILLSGQNSSTYVPLTNSTGSMFYYCIVTQEIGSGCNVTSETAQVIVNTAPAINLNPQPNTYCVNQVATPLTVGYINGTGTPVYKWFSNVTNTNSGGILVNGQTNSSFMPPTNTDGNIYYYCTITFPSLVGGCEVITSTTALITVNNFPVITSEIQTICSTNTFLITPLNGSGNIVPVGTSYIWSQPIINPAGALTGFSAQTTPQSEISQILNNATTSPATATYTITPTSGVCVGPDFTVTITVNPLINPNVIVNNNACFGVNNASISTNITGGIAPYTITWTGPNGFTSSATTISNIEPGTYMLTIDDIGNCPFTNSYTITQPDDIVILTNSQTNSTCFGSNNGTIDLSITGGTGSYSYAWTKNNIAFATTQDLSNLSPGTYTATVSDENNCGPKTITFTVTEPPLLVVTLVNKTNIDCFGTSTGAINIQVVGGTIAVDYNFYWTGPNGFTSTSKNLTSLFSGTYNLTVTDDNGCQKTLQVILTQSPEIIISFTTTEITCYGSNNASLTTLIVGGSAPYSFVWDNLATSLNQDNLAAGNYTITVTDNLGCIKLATVNIPEAPIFTINPVVKNVSCFGANNGSINLNLVGGIAPVSLSWSDGSTAGLTRNNLSPGTYTATITDGKPCVIVRTFIIIQPQTLVLSANLVNPTNCNNANSGAIDLIVSGGTPPFSYSWSNGTTNEDLINAIAGSYSVTVLDKNGCSASAQYTLIRPEPITISVTTQTDFNCTTHQVKQNFVAQASGGVPPFTYQWSSGNISGNNNQIMNTDTNGIVILTVFDSLGCSQTYTVNVDNLEIGYATFEPTSVSYTSFGLFSINDPIQFTSTITGDYESIFWDFGDGTFSSELNPLHTFLIPKDYVVTQTVTYPFGCVYKHVITLTVEKGYLLVLPTGFTPNNDSLNDKYRPVAKGLKNITMDIYDSWGSIIYSEKGDVIKGWDGKIKGFDAENGNYYSKVAGETFYGTTVYESQTIVLIK